MSYSNSIRKLIDIQDPNITFEEELVETRMFRNKKVKFVNAKLTYDPLACEVCGIKNKNFTVYKNGTQISRITLPVTGVYPTYLNLKKQRFKCKSCECTFTAKTPIVEKYCFISKNTKAQITIKAAEAQSMKSISRDCSVSDNTVQRVINDSYEQFKPVHNKLPEHLSFDEFKYAKGMMAFQYVDAQTGVIYDILSQRTKRVIRNHFIANYSLNERKKVKTVTIDMNAGYASVIKELFPKARIIIDRFHLVQLISRSMNKTRIRLMNNFKTSNGNDMKKYRRLKKYWKLILKSKSDLSSVEYKNYSMFGQRLETAVVDELLSYDEELKVNYTVYQSLLKTMQDRNFDELTTILNRLKMSTVSSYMKTSIKTLKKYLTHIENSFIFPYSNGRIEGINNKIKVLNRVSYGYRNFLNFKKRIFLYFKLRPHPIKSKENHPHNKAA